MAYLGRGGAILSSWLGRSYVALRGRAQLPSSQDWRDLWGDWVLRKTPDLRYRRIDVLSDELVTSSADSGSSSVTVPEGCDFVVIGTAGWDNNDLFPGTVTLNGNSVTVLETHVSAAAQKMLLGYWQAPVAGSQTLAWNWVDTDAVAEGVLILLTYLRGVHRTNPVIASDVSTLETDVVGMGPVGMGDLMIGSSTSFDVATVVTGEGQTSLQAPARFNLTFLRSAWKRGATTYVVSSGEAEARHAAVTLRAAPLGDRPFATRTMLSSG